MENESKLLRMKDAAARLAVSVRTLYRLVAAHELAVIHVRGCACISEADLVEYVARKKQGGK
jgi:excisionase family DNA binding protein